MAKTESISRMQKGDVAPDFALPGIDGRSYSLKGFSHREGVLVVFMCNHCPYVKARMADLAQIHKEFGKRVALVGINPSDPEYAGEGMEKMKEFASGYGMEFAYLLDEDGAVAKAYGATCTPDPFLFDKDLKLVFHGRIVNALEPKDAVTEKTMADNIRKMLTAQPVDPWFDPSLGCSIKFK